MSTRSIWVLGLFSLLVLFSCGTFDDDGITKPLSNSCLDLGNAQLVLSIQDKFTTLPGKVSVFFKVNDKDGNPVSGLKSNNFNVFERGRNDQCFSGISSSESFAKISPNSQVFRNNTFLVLDLSNSVLSSSLSQLKSAATTFIDNVMPATPDEAFKMSIYWFDGEDNLHLLNELTSNSEELKSSIDGITDTISQDPSTDLYGTVIKATDIASEKLAEFENLDIFAAASVVLFTDGTDQAARYSKSSAINKVNNANKNITFFSIGLGNEIDETVLTQIGKTTSVFADNSQELEDRFNEISLSVAGQANSFYLFEYCSPKRDGSGTNELIIQANDSERQGAINTNFDATGFTSGCQ